MKLSKWIVVDGYCATRVFFDTDPADVRNRLAFIEKAPRVKLTVGKYGIENEIKNNVSCCGAPRSSAWIFGPKGSGGSGDAEKEGNYGFNSESRKWCDDILILLGYELEN